MDGRWYDGEWSDGKYNGRGRYKGKDGIVREGMWQLGMRKEWINE